jgi:predicted nucleic acid-binding protein
LNVVSAHTLRCSDTRLRDPRSQRNTPRPFAARSEGLSNLAVGAARQRKHSWTAFAYRRDRAHRRPRDHFAALRARGDLLVTSDPAVGETITRLRYDAGLAAALAFRRILQEAVDLQTLRIRDTDASLRKRALELMEQYGDLRLSYADCVGAAVAREVEASAIFGLDNDFRVLGFAVEP